MTLPNGGAHSVNGHARTAEKKLADVHLYKVDERNTAPRQPKLSERTDYSRWRLLDDKGRQTWHYLVDDEQVKEWPQSKADKYFLGLPLVRLPFRFPIQILTL